MNFKLKYMMKTHTLTHVTVGNRFIIVRKKLITVNRKVVEISSHEGQSLVAVYGG
jgi:hypothetical protein